MSVLRACGQTSALRTKKDLRRDERLPARSGCERWERNATQERKVWRDLSFVLILLTSICSSEAMAQKSWNEIEFPPLKQFEIPAPVTESLPNGLRIYLLEDHTLPMVQAVATVRAGSAWEPMEKAGLARITGTVMRTGGTASHKGEELDELLENLGASVETAIDRTEATANLFVLREDLALGIEMLADILRNPAFPEEKIELAKVTLRDSIARRNDDIGGIVDREFKRLVQGSDSPYARQPEYSTVAAITREDLVSFHGRFFRPENVLIGFVGDFDSGQVLELVAREFGDWAGDGPPDGVVMPEVLVEGRNAVFLVEKKEVNQTQFAIGHLGGLKSDPDFYSLVVMSEIFGSGGFSSRLLNEVRTKRGLGYFAYGGWGTGYETPGLFIMRGGTKSGSTVAAIRVFVQTLRGMLEQEPTAGELKQAKDSILNSFVFNFDTPEKIISRIIRYAYHGYPADTLLRFKAGIEEVTVQDVVRVARKHLRPDELVYLVVGNPEEFDAPLTELGAGEPVPLDISIKVPVEKAPEGDAASFRRGSEVWKQVRESYGGEALAGLRSFRLEASIQLNTPQGNMTLKARILRELPCQVQSTLELPFGSVRQLFDGKSLTVESPQGTRTMPESAAAAELEKCNLELFNLLADSDLQVQFLRETAQDKKPAYEIRVVRSGEQGAAATLVVEAETGRILTKTYRSVAEGAPAEVVETSMNWRQVDGILFPFRREATKDGKPFMTMVVHKIEVNPAPIR